MNSKALEILMLVFLTLFSNAAFSNEDAKYSHYKINLKLDPATQYLNVKMELKIVVQEELPDTLVFSLHRQLSQLKVTGPSVETFIFNQDSPPSSIFMPNARPLLVILDQNTPKEEELTLSFEYEGTLTEWPEYSANIFTEEWVELGLYLPWFPISQIAGSFTFEIEAACDPDYQLRSFGQYSIKSGKWYLRQLTPTFDIVLVASKNLKTLEHSIGNNTAYIHYQTLQESTVKEIANDLVSIFNLYESWFGGSQKGNILTLIESDRGKGGDYFRNDLVVLSGLSDKKYFNEHENFIRYLSHEIAHSWWHMSSANIWEDWMNEGFAEYSALMVVREQFGDEPFKKLIEDKKKVLKGTPPIWEFDRSGMSTTGKPKAVEVNLYSKGPVLLHLLSERLGDNAFIKLCREMIETNISNTDDFLNMIEENHGIEIRNWFEDLLKTY